MMKVVEQSSDHLRLSNADPEGNRAFVFGIIVVLVSGMFISVKVIKPACWSGLVIGVILLILLISAIPHSFDTEFWFDRENNELKIIKYPWIGKPTVENYPLSDIKEVKVVSKPRHTHNYPGHDYDDAEFEQPEESLEYHVELFMHSGNVLTIYEATHLVPTIKDFLAFTLTANRLP